MPARQDWKVYNWQKICYGINYKKPNTNADGNNIFYVDMVVFITYNF